MNIFTQFSRWLGFGGITERTGKQSTVPGVSLVAGTTEYGVDGALQLETVWACVNRRASTIASLPFFAYETKNGQKTLARDTNLYSLLHESPNSRMTPLEFWRCMVMNHDLRGNAYARIDRRADGSAVALWPMPADQVQVVVLADGSMVYQYTIGSDIAVFAAENVLHLKDLGNGTVGLSKLEYMRASIDEAAKAQGQATKVFATGGKPTGVLMVDKLLTEPQREAIRQNFAEMETGSTTRLFVLEANMTYQQLGISPQDQQLLETRVFSVEVICRWFDVPPVLVHHSNVTAWGSGIAQIVDGFHKLSVRPMLISIEQAVRKRVMTPKERSTMSVEFNFDALLRGNLAERYESYSKAVQNGFLTRNEVRQYENMPPDANGNELTAQSNLMPLNKLGQMPQGKQNANSENPIAQ